MIEADAQKVEAPAQGLRRSLGLGLLVFYGLGVIIGAGVYVVIGDVVEQAGSWAILSFILAGSVAALIAICYAELGARFPEAAGEAAYVQEAFHTRWFSQVAGFAVALVVLVSAATIARGSAGYAQSFVHLPDWLIAGLLVVLFTLLGCLGVKDSVRAAAAMTIVELGGLLFALATGTLRVAYEPTQPLDFVPHTLPGWERTLAGAFLAFFAFTGFESLANIAEEVSSVRRTLPRAILLSLAISTILYVAVALVLLAIVPIGEVVASPAPLLLIFGADSRAWGSVFAAVAVVAVANGVLIQILTLSRLLYGMANRALLPGWLRSVDQRRQVPQRATITAGLAVLASTVALPFHSLLRLSTTVTLLLFALVGACLWRLQRRAPPRELPFRAWPWVPIAATLASFALVANQVIGLS